MEINQFFIISARLCLCYFIRGNCRKIIQPSSFLFLAIFALNSEKIVSFYCLLFKKFIIFWEKALSISCFSFPDETQQVLDRLQALQNLVLLTHFDNVTKNDILRPLDPLNPVTLGTNETFEVSLLVGLFFIRNDDLHIVLYIVKI